MYTFSKLFIFII